MLPPVGHSRKLNLNCSGQDLNPETAHVGPKWTLNLLYHNTVPREKFWKEKLDRVLIFWIVTTHHDTDV